MTGTGNLTAMWTSLLLAASLALHPNSISSSSITPTEAGFDVALRFQALSLVEVVDVDRERDGRLTPAELAEQEAAVLAYLGQHYRLFVDGDEPRPLDFVPGDLALGFDSHGLDLGSQWVEAVLGFALADGASGDLLVECDLFLETSPDHRDFARFVGPPTVDWLFSAAAPSLVLPGAILGGTTGPPTLDSHPGQVQGAGLGDWARMGLEHILTGYDHLLFVLGLVLAAGSLRSLAITVTAFTLAHSVTLGLAALGHVPAGGLWVELGIALSIVVVGARNLIQGVPRPATGEALGFGLLHGLGFAGLLAGALGEHEGGRLLPLLGFNLGIEAGQLLVALPLGWILFRWTGRAPRPSPDPGFDAPVGDSALTRGLSCVVLVAGLGWVVLRSIQAFG
ncbi:MAG: HupE/UreJ family protein [Planctomycetota bacterium]|nr:HupE/UreJ family protein [Planctomycetota bacterium]